MTERTDLLVVGGGLAAVTIVRALRSSGDTRSIIVASAEEHIPYDRPPLSKDVLNGTMSVDAAALLTPDDIRALDIDLRLGWEAVALHPVTPRVEFGNHRAVEADDVVLACGSRARVLDAARGIKQVRYLRTHDDALALKTSLATAQDVVIIGAGFIGLEVAAVARTLGKSVTVIESAPEPLARVLGPDAGRIVADLHRERGVELRCGVGVAGLAQEGARAVVTLEDGQSLSADVVVVGIGSVPCDSWLHESGVTVDNGVVCDGAGRTSRDHIWAAGDVARWPNSTTGLTIRAEQWQTALDQAQVVSANLHSSQSAVEQLGTLNSTWHSTPYFWSDQYGIKIQFVGHAGGQSEVVVAGDRPVVLFREGNRPCGVLALDSPRLLSQARRLLDSGSTYDEVRALLVGHK